ncbi:MAG: glycosyl transferase family 1, partial [Conexibacter sp.]|nr:glycosyl transferase family 1 [Conexibacter sp.]
LHAAHASLLADPARRTALAAAATEAARTTYAWDAIAQQHLALYAALGRA